MCLMRERRRRNRLLWFHTVKETRAFLTCYLKRDLLITDIFILCFFSLSLLQINIILRGEFGRKLEWIRGQECSQEEYKNRWNKKHSALADQPETWGSVSNNVFKTIQYYTTYQCHRHEWALILSPGDNRAILSCENIPYGDYLHYQHNGEITS